MAFAWINKLLQLFKKPARPSTEPPRATLAVVVVDAKTKKPLSGATFRFNEVLRTTTNSDGYAALEAYQGRVNYAIELDKYHAVHDKILLQENTQLSIELATIRAVSPYPRINGQLRDAMRQFVDDTGIVLPVFAHAGDLFALYVRDKQRALAEIQKIADAGFQGFRVWTVLYGPYWEKPNRDVSPTKTSNYWELWESFSRSVNEEGLKLVVSQGDLNAWSSDMTVREAFATKLAEVEQRIGNGIYAFVDAGNETWQNGEPDPKRLAKFVEAYRRAGGRALLTLTSPPGEETQELDEFSIDPAQCYDVHGYRAGRFYDKIRHIFSIPYEGKPRRALGIQSEPTGNGELVSASENKHELDDEAVALLGTMSLIARQAWVWFSGEGVRIQNGIDTESGFAATPRLAAVLPKDIMTFMTFHHSGNTWSHVRIVDQGVTHECRVDGAQSTDGRCVYLFYGEPGTHQFRAAKNFSGTLYHPATGEGEPFSKKAGETFWLTWGRGRVFVGKID